MRPTEASTRSMRPLSNDELSAVAGGLLPANLGPMPDRSVMCCTMWYLDRLIRIFGGRA